MDLNCQENLRAWRARKKAKKKKIKKKLYDDNKEHVYALRIFGRKLNKN